MGHWYSAYNLARALQEYPKAELVAVAWHNSAQLAAFTSSFQVSGYSDYGELLKREEIDLVHLATPVSEMADCTIRAARAGKHIVLGKPMAMTMEQADQMRTESSPHWKPRGRSTHRVRPARRPSKTPSSVWK